MSEDDFLHGCPPPWTTFPEIDPDELPAYLKQGLTEWWFDEAWRPFWNPLSMAQREQYLDYWQAPEKWRENLHFVFPHTLEFNPEEDMKESEEYLRKWRESRPKRSLLARIFGLWK